MEEELFQCRCCKKFLNEDCFQKEHKRNGKLRMRLDRCKSCKRDYNKFLMESREAKNKRNLNQKTYRNTSLGKIGMLTQAARDRSRKSNLPCDLEYDFMRDLFYITQKGRCKYSDVEMVLDGSSKWLAASIDRIDPTKGYLKDNVQWLTMRMNTMKLNMPYEEFLYLCKKVVEKSSETIENTENSGS